MTVNLSIFIRADFVVFYVILCHVMLCHCVRVRARVCEGVCEFVWLKKEVHSVGKRRGEVK